MMSISKVNNADYHLEHSQYDYYSEQENEKGEFRGALMKWQKLEGKEVDEKNYMKQISHGGADNKGVDLCFSPPKDWTLLYNLADDETRLKMDSIREKAVNAIVKGIEQNTYYRETKDGETSYVLARGVGMAVFNHHTSREVKDEGKNNIVDPQEHTHITVFPKVLGQDGKFHSHTLLDMKYEKGNDHESLRYLDQLGQYELAKGLQDLGFNVYENDKHGNFAIEGISDELRTHFSKRHKQIEDKAGEGASYTDKQKVSLQVRASKSSNDLATLRKNWQAEMNGLGFNQESIKTMKNSHSINHKDRNLNELLTDEEKDKSISNKKLKLLALRESKFSKVSYTEKLNEFKADKKVRSISKKQNIYANNKAKEKLCDRVDKIKADRKKERLNKSNDFKKEQNNLDKKDSKNIGSKSSKPSTKNNDSKPSNQSAPSLAVMPMVGGSGGGSGSKEELLSSINDLELKMFSFPPIAERTPEQHKQVAQIESQIGSLKEQVKQMEEQQSRASEGGLGGFGGEESKEKSNQQSFKSPEEKENELLDRKANEIVDLVNKEDTIKEGSSSTKLNNIQKEFNKEHKMIVDEILEQHQQIQLTL